MSSLVASFYFETFIRTETFLTSVRMSIACSHFLRFAMFPPLIMLPLFVRKIVHLSPFSMFVTCLLECFKCFQKFPKTFKIIMIFFSNNLIFISLFAKLWQMMSKYVIAVITVLVSNNPSNNLGLSTVPKMLAQFELFF